MVVFGALLRNRFAFASRLLDLHGVVFAATGRASVGHHFSLFEPGNLPLFFAMLRVLQLVFNFLLGFHIDVVQVNCNPVSGPHILVRKLVGQSVALNCLLVLLKELLFHA